MITNVVNFGAFARLEEGLEGLIHVSELAEGCFMHPRNVIREGDHVRARVLLVDSVKRRIALTLRPADAPVCSHTDMVGAHPRRLAGRLTCRAVPFARLGFGIHPKTCYGRFRKILDLEGFRRIFR